MAYVPVKVYRNNEIRRFLLEAGENQRFAFQQLLNQVHLVFPNLDISRVKVMWKDTDGELIVMSSDLELMDAIRSLPANDQMLRLHLVDTVAGAQPEPVATPDVVVIFQEQPQQQEQEPQRQEDGQQQADAEEPMDQDPTRHRHVFCDGCRGSIIGIRHKCLVCPDYDLCPDCIQKGTHDEHVMIRIVSPKDKSWKPAFFAAQSPFPFRPHGRGGCGRGPWMPHHGPDARGPFPPAPPAGPQGPQGPFPPPFFHHRGGHHHRGAGPCFRGRHMHGWAPTCPARFPEEKKQEQTPGQEKPQEPQEGATLFNSQELARDVNDAIQSLMAAFGKLTFCLWFGSVGSSCYLPEHPLVSHRSLYHSCVLECNLHPSVFL